MISKNDIILLLADIDAGDTTQYVTKVMNSTILPLDVLKFINDKRPLDVTEFYTRIRKNYNNKRSDLYKNLMKELTEDNIQDVLTTLASYSLQILLYSKKLDNKEFFLKASRFEEVQKCLLDYAQTYNITNCVKLLRLIKSDIKAINYISGHEDIEGNLIKK